MRLIKYLKYAFLLVVGIALVLVAMANRDIVTLELVPAELSSWAGVHPTIDLPLFIVVLGSVALGLLIGFVWEWLREHRHRAEARSQKRAATQLEREVKSLKRSDTTDKDDILALIDDAEKAN